MATRIGIVGAGGMVDYHIDGFLSAGGDVVAIADVAVEKARSVAESRGIPHVFDDVSDLLRVDGLDAVSVIVPNKFHAPLSIQALENGVVAREEELAATQAAFEHNVQDASDAWSLHIRSEAELAGLPPHAIERAAAEARKRDRQGWLLTLDYPTYDAVMRHAESRALRESLYQAWVTRASDQGADPAWDNSANIDRILSLRH